MDKISVVIPVYNVEQYLTQCLDSILSQTYTNIEVIIVDDKSPDNCPEIIDTYAQKDNRVKVIHNKENQGYAKSVNNGIKTATGNYIAIIESDDFIDKEMFSTLYELITKNDCDIAKCHFYQYFGEKNENISGETIFSKIPNNKAFTLKEIPIVLKAHPSIWAALYKRSLLLDNNIFFTETPNGAFLDILFTFKAMICAKKIIVTDTPYLHYRQDNSNSTINNPKKIFCISNEYDLLTKYLNEHLDIKPYVNQYKLKKQYRDYKWNLQRIAPKYKEQFLARFVKTFKELTKEENFNKNFPQKHKKELNLLLNNPQKYLENYGIKRQNLLKKIIKININNTGIFISVLGKQIINIERNKYGKN